MDKQLAVKALTGRIEYYGDSKRIQATAELHDLGQGPYFGVTGDIGPSQDPDCCGCIHDEIVKAFPELEPFIKWHGAHIDRGPWHYIENAKYWAGWSAYCTGKESDPPNLEHLKSTIVWGVLDGETDNALVPFMGVSESGMGSKKDPDEKAAPLVAMLQARHGAMMDKFHAAMVELFEGQITASQLSGIRAEYEAKTR